MQNESSASENQVNVMSDFGSNPKSNKCRKPNQARINNFQYQIIMQIKEVGDLRDDFN